MDPSLLHIHLLYILSYIPVSLLLLLHLFFLQITHTSINFQIYQLISFSYSSYLPSSLLPPPPFSSSSSLSLSSSPSSFAAAAAMQSLVQSTSECVAVVEVTVAVVDVGG